MLDLNDDGIAIDPKTAEIVNALFASLTTIFPAFKQAWPTQREFDMAKQQWTKAFMECGLSDVEMIKAGLKKYRSLTTPFVPSPGQFIAMCKQTPEELGLPSLEKAYDEAVKNSYPYKLIGEEIMWSHPIVQEARRIVGSSILREAPKSKSFPLFKEEYLKLVNKYLENAHLIRLEKKDE